MSNFFSDPDFNRAGVVIALLLAAGASRRFGSNKLLAPVDDGSAMVVASARHLVDAGCPVLAVVGPVHEAVSAQLRTIPGVCLTLCPDAGDGIGNSVAWGVAQSHDASGWLVALGDMPFIDPRTIRALVARLRQGAGIVAPVHEGRRGHPVGFSAAWREELMALQGDEGARRIIAANPGMLETLPCADPGVVHDVDRRSDLLPRFRRPTAGR